MSDAKTPKKQKDRERTGAEMTTLLISIAILVALVGSLLFIELTRGHAKAGLKITPHYSKAFERDGSWYLPVDVTNTGDEPTDTVRVELTRPIEGEDPEVSDLDFIFVAGGETASGYAIFDEKPTADTIEADPISYTEPG